MDKLEHIFDITDKTCTKYVYNFKKRTEFIEDFRHNYHYIKCYHATRLNTTEIDLIKKNGLIIPSITLLREKAKARFILDSDTPHLQEQILVELDILLENLVIEEKVFFSLIKKELETTSYQYLLLGPESLSPLAHKLKEKFQISFQNRMREFGLPYFVVANIPVNRTTDFAIGSIFEYLINKFPECSLIYYDNLPNKQIIDIYEVDPPKDIYSILS